MKAVRWGAGLVAMALAPTFGAPVQAAIVTMSLSGTWGVTSNGSDGADPFSGTFTYDTAALSYLNAPYSALYGNAGAPAGSYTISWGGQTYSAAIRTIQVQQLAECDSVHTASCLKLDMALASTILGYGDGRFYALLGNDAPFDTVLLPDAAPSSATAVFASLSLPQATTEGRFTTVGSTPGIVPANAGATFSFGPVAASDVPEPASWAMMILGFGLAGGVVRHRRRSVAFA